METKWLRVEVKGVDVDSRTLKGTASTSSEDYGGDHLGEVRRDPHDVRAGVMIRYRPRSRRAKAGCGSGPEQGSTER